MSHDPGASTWPDLSEVMIQLPQGPTLAGLQADGPNRPFLLVHGLASNARLWEPVGRRLAAAGHSVMAVDLRGHGRSSRPQGGYSTTQAAADLGQLIDILGWTAARSPIVAGQSWGGNVVIHLAGAPAAGGVSRAHAVVAVDGGWIQLGDRFPTFEQCWDELAPPDFAGVTWETLTPRLARMLTGWPAGSLDAVLGNLEPTGAGGVRNRLARGHHRSILKSLWSDDPRLDYRGISIPTRFLVAGDRESAPEKTTAVQEAVDLISDCTVTWYPGAHHDLHLQHPDRVSLDLLQLTEEPAGQTGPR